MLPEVQLHKGPHAPPPSPAPPRTAASGHSWQEVLMPSNPDHQVTFPPSKGPPLPSHSYFFGCFPRFCFPPSDPKLLLSSPARQGPCKVLMFKRSTCPERMGSLHRRGAWGAQGGGGNQGHVPPPRSLPKEGFAGAKHTKGLRREPGRGIPQRQVGTSQLHFQVLFLAKRGEKSVFCCLPHP